MTLAAGAARLAAAAFPPRAPAAAVSPAPGGADGIEALPVLGDMALWRVDLRREARAERVARLSDVERQRADRFVFAADRRRFLASHCALRELLGGWLGLAPEGITYRTGAHGKPQLAEGRLCFNMSHSQDWALIGIGAAGEIGVDLEMLHDVDDIDLLAQRLFTARELRQLAAAPAHHRPVAFLQGWTRKEACLKAIGTGLSLEPVGIDAGLEPIECTLRVAMPGGEATLSVQSFDAGAGHVAAFARVCAWRPVTP